MLHFVNVGLVRSGWVDYYHEKQPFYKLISCYNLLELSSVISTILINMQAKVLEISFTVVIIYIVCV